MDELIRQAAERLGYPADLVDRSARARAAADGVAVEAVLSAWAGGGDIDMSAAAPAAAPAAETAPAAAAPAAAETPSGPAVEVIPAAAEEQDEPEPVVAERDEPEEESLVGALPRWLVAAFLVVPSLALIYALFLPNGPECGEGAVLAIDPVTGAAVNCDGSPYGQDTVDFFAIGQATYSQCAACHGAGGAGAGSFPGFTGGAVLATFPVGQCTDHVDWVRLGTNAWPEATYGANATPVGGSGAIMPGFGNALTEDELRSVVLFERVQFGGVGLAEAITDCGLGDETVAAAE